MLAGPRLATACLVASRIAESLLLKAWSLEQIDELFAEDQAIVALTCQIAMGWGTSGRAEWSGQGAPFEGLQKAAEGALDKIAAGAMRSRGESHGAGVNATITGRQDAPPDPQFMFAPNRLRPRRGGY
jgi:hypothetical protein